MAFLNGGVSVGWAAALPDSWPQEERHGLWRMYVKKDST
jgi:hypothetical protein